MRGGGVGPQGRWRQRRLARPRAPHGGRRPRPPRRRRPRRGGRGGPGHLRGRVRLQTVPAPGGGGDRAPSAGPCAGPPRPPPAVARGPGAVLAGARAGGAGGGEARTGPQGAGLGERGGGPFSSRVPVSSAPRPGAYPGARAAAGAAGPGNPPIALHVGKRTSAPAPWREGGLP